MIVRKISIENHKDKEHKRLHSSPNSRLFHAAENCRTKVVCEYSPSKDGEFNLMTQSYALNKETTMLNKSKWLLKTSHSNNRRKYLLNNEINKGNQVETTNKTTREFKRFKLNSKDKFFIKHDGTIIGNSSLNDFSKARILKNEMIK